MARDVTALAGKIETLQGVELFRDLNRAQLAKVARVTEDVDVSEGRDVVREQTLRESGGASFFLIVDGKADVLVRGRKIARLNPGDAFGELSLLTGRPRNATVRAASQMQLFRIRSGHFQKLVKQEPAIAMGLLRNLAERLRTAEENANRSR